MLCAICSRVVLCLSARAPSECHESIRLVLSPTAFVVFGVDVSTYAAKTVLIMVIGANDMGALYCRMLMLNKASCCSPPFRCSAG